LSRQPPARLLLVCDAHLTPDRGALSFIATLAALAGQTRVWLLPRADGGADRAAVWRERLAALNVAGVTSGEEAVRWLEGDRRSSLHDLEGGGGSSPHDFEGDRRSPLQHIHRDD
jgi:hypothetical protein